MLMNEFKGKVAVVTGAARGLGRGIAMRCAREGMNVVLADIRADALMQTEADLKALGARTLVVQTDVSRADDVDRLAAKSFDTFGTVDLLINNAGVAVESSVLNSSLDDWNWVMGVNFYGALHGVRAFVPRMIAQGTVGHVVNVASLGGVVEAIDPYHVSKHATVAMSESLYHDLADAAAQIGVSVFMPGLVDTELYRAEDARPDRFASETPPIDPEYDYEDWKEMFRNFGIPIDDAVDILFEGLAEGTLYIGPIAFQKQGPGILDAIRTRADNIAAERNPDHPRNLGPTHPA
jgi:NAD(P)-dependent dehydrogenase (short-subunit alcohol dehydrogenase family)